MIWRSKLPLVRILKGVAAALTMAIMTVFAPPAHANWGEMAMVSETMGISDSRICIGEGSRGDLGCPSYAPTISPTGRINAAAGLTVNTVSLTTTGTTWGYLGSSQSYLPNVASAQVSSTAISTTAVQIASSTTVTACTANNAGTLRYNSSNTALELCTGSGWQVMGVGIPAGTISAFASTTCPTGWSEYTAARGRFLRGIDNGAGNDPDGTRAPGAVQADMLGSHNHTIPAADVFNTSAFIINDNSGDIIASSDNAANGGNVTLRLNRYYADAKGGPETRPKNVAVTFCQFNGTSNGWNNPLSGGSTSASGSTGQIQYNTSGRFDASAGLTWNNAASRLTAINISATSLTVNGVAITGSSSGDRITSGTTSMVANPSGTIEVNGGIRLMSATTAPVCTAATVGTIAHINGRTFECRM
ncbi:complement C1q protein (plasmid) [Agrobacterium tumefaciens F2]|nr:complement C1q protein [Agrobacterium tumefaciens F2]